jgi:hypothetical protein
VYAVVRIVNTVVYAAYKVVHVYICPLGVCVDICVCRTSNAPLQCLRTILKYSYQLQLIYYFLKIYSSRRVTFYIFISCNVCADVLLNNKSIKLLRLRKMQSKIHSLFVLFATSSVQFEISLCS